MNLRPAGYWLLLVTCVVTWPGCAQPLFKRKADTGPPRSPRQVSQSDKHEGQISQARLTERSGQKEQAQRMYLALIEKQPKNPVPYHRLGVIAAQEKKWRVAEQHFNQAYSLAPSSPELLSDMGYLYYLQNRNQEAENILRQALSLDADHKAASNNLGLVLGEEQRFDESLDVFRRAGSEAEARANLAFVLAQQGRYDQALSTYSEALSHDQKLRPAAMAMLQLAQRRPGTPANPNLNAPQIASREQPAQKQPNHHEVRPAALDMVVSDAPTPVIPEMPKAAMPKVVMPVVVARTDSRLGRVEPITDGGVVLANCQQEQVAPKQMPEPGPPSKTQAPPPQVVRPNPAPALATREIVRQEPPEEIVPEITFKREPERDLDTSEAPESSVKLNRLGIEP